MNFLARDLLEDLLETDTPIDLWIDQLDDLEKVKKYIRKMNCKKHEIETTQYLRRFNKFKEDNNIGLEMTDVEIRNLNIGDKFWTVGNEMPIGGEPELLEVVSIRNCELYLLEYECISISQQLKYIQHNNIYGIIYQIGFFFNEDGDMNNSMEQFHRALLYKSDSLNRIR